MDWQIMPAFLLATLALLATPGPIMAIVAGNTLRGGGGGGLLTVAGVGVGEAFLLGATAISLLATNALLPKLIPFLSAAGGIYLACLACIAFRCTTRPGASTQPDCASRGAPFFGGLSAAIANPLALLFYAAFLLPFANGRHALPLEISRFAAIYFTTSVLFDIGCVLLVQRLNRSGLLSGAAHRPISLVSAFVYLAIAATTLRGFL